MKSQEAEKLCRQLMAEHGLSHWHFKWIKSNNCFGQCDYLNRCIILSFPLVESNGVEQVRDTILHEIAHALAGLKAKHGPLWVMVAKRIGCDGKRCFTWNDVNKPEALQPKDGYVGACECGPRTHYVKRDPSEYTFPSFCSKCHKRINFIKQ